MSDSTATKSTLAAALKALIRTTPFEKVKVTDICRECGINRKSFYYHFKDKYDLVNWIFDSECADAYSTADLTCYQDYFLCTLKYMHSNRSFYRRVLQIKGQNSFSEHLRQKLYHTMHRHFSSVLSGESLDFNTNFLTDAFMCTTERWLLDRNCMSPDQLWTLIDASLRDAVGIIYLHAEQLRTSAEPDEVYSPQSAEENIAETND